MSRVLFRSRRVSFDQFSCLDYSYTYMVLSDQERMGELGISAIPIFTCVVHVLAIRNYEVLLWWLTLLIEGLCSVHIAYHLCVVARALCDIAMKFVSYKFCSCDASSG